MTSPGRETYLFCGQDILAPEGAGRFAAPPSAASGFPTAASPGAVPDPVERSPSAFRDYEWAGRPYRALWLDEAAAAAAAARGFRRVPVRQALGELEPDATRPLLRGLSLLRWLETARFCGSCGAALEDCPPEGVEPGGRRCPDCGRVFFPRISPAVIVLVHRDGKALLAHNARFPAGRFGLIAGFVEAGETAEETAVRESREEAGIEIRGLRYRRSQSWPFPDSLMLAFTAEWASGEPRPDGREIDELRWCGSDDVPGIPATGSVARSLIDEFLEESRRKPH
jgi:NAD+ diphosphatase